VCQQLLKQIPEHVLAQRCEDNDDEVCPVTPANLASECLRGLKEQEDPCDGGRACSCMKPLAEHPEAKWSLSRAAVRRFNMMREQLQYRDAGSFGIQIFGEYSIWGTIKVIDNQILDFQEANDWKEQWAVCEALAILLGAEELSDMEWYVTHILPNLGYSLNDLILDPRIPLVS
jgi:hypothetical protein